MADLYANYAQLAAATVEGVDYSRTTIAVSGATWASIAIHGGGIERGSGEMARQVAGTLMSFYEFAGLRTSNNTDLHITSTNFDEPNAVALVSASQRTISFHGFVGSTGVAETAIGGLDTELVQRITNNLLSAGFAVVTAPSEIAGTDPLNICNENARSKGVQLEMSRALRDSFFPGGATPGVAPVGRTDAFYRYAKAVQDAYIGLGKMSMSAINSSRWNILPVKAQNVSAMASVSTDKLATGGGEFNSIALRFVDVSNCYTARVEFSPTQTVILTIRKRIAGTETLLVQYTSPLTHTVNGRVAWRFEANGSVLRARVWDASTVEPSTWNLTVEDLSLQDPGAVALRSILSSSNTNTLPVVSSWGDFSLKSVDGTPISTALATSSALGIKDGFSRTVSGGWGQPDIGPVWAVRSGPIGDVSTISGVGRMSMTQRSVSGSLGTEYVMGSALNHTDVDQVVKFRPTAPPAGDTLRFALVARETDRDNWWEFETGFLTNGNMQVRIGREVNGAGVYENPVTVPITYTAGAWYWMRFQVIGSTLRGRAWKDGTTEPSTWDMSIVRTLLPSGNFVGVKAFSSAFSSNPTPEVVEFDDYSLTILDNTTVIEADDAGTTWLKSVGQPALSRRVNMVEFDEHGRPGRILGEYEVLNRQNKVVLTDTLGGREGSLTLVTYQMNGVWASDSYWRDIQSLIANGGTLLLQTAGTTFTAEDDMYLEVKNLSRKRVGLVGGELVHLHTIDFIEVDRPASIQESLSLRNWQSVLNQNSTWQDVLTNHTSWLDVLQRDL